MFGLQSEKCGKTAPDLVTTKVNESLTECKTKGFADVTQKGCGQHKIKVLQLTENNCQQISEYLSPDCDWTALPQRNPNVTDSAPNGTDPKTPLPFADTTPQSGGIVDLKSFGSLSLCLAFIITIWINV